MLEPLTIEETGTEVDAHKGEVSRYRGVTCRVSTLPDAEEGAPKARLRTGKSLPPHCCLVPQEGRRLWKLGHCRLPEMALVICYDSGLNMLAKSSSHRENWVVEMSGQDVGVDGSF